MESLPTIDECSTLILDHVQTILNFIDKGIFDNNTKEITQTTLDISKKEKIKLFNKLDRYSKYKQNINMLKLLVR
jgi:hypothetical protein